MQKPVVHLYWDFVKTGFINLNTGKLVNILTRKTKLITFKYINKF